MTNRDSGPCQFQRQQAEQHSLRGAELDAGAPAGSNRAGPGSPARSSTKVKSTACMRVLQIPPNSRTSARPDRAAAPTSNCGTRIIRSRAIVDSIIPTKIAKASMPANATPTSTITLPVATGTTRPDDQRAEHPDLQGRAVQDEREVRPAVVEHHHLVDHRQFEVGIGVVDGNARVLGQEDDQQGHGDQGQGEPAFDPAAAG